MQQKPNVPRARRKRQASNDAKVPRTASAHLRHSIQDLVPELIAMVANGPDAESGEQKLEGLISIAKFSKNEKLGCLKRQPAIPKILPT